MYFQHGVIKWYSIPFSSSQALLKFWYSLMLVACLIVCCHRTKTGFRGRFEMSCIHHQCSCLCPSCCANYQTFNLMLIVTRALGTFLRE